MAGPVVKLCVYSFYYSSVYVVVDVGVELVAAQDAFVYYLGRRPVVVLG